MCGPVSHHEPAAAVDFSRAAIETAPATDAREPWRHTSVIAPVATGSIMGFGVHGYDYAVRAIAELLR